MAIAHDAAPAERSRWEWAADNALVRAVGRLPWPLGAKLIAGFAVVAALLAIVAALGLTALSQSNSRGLELPQLNANQFYESILVADAEQLKSDIDFRLSLGASPRGGWTAGNKTIVRDLALLCVDAGLGGCGVGGGGVGPLGLSRFPAFTLNLVDPSLNQKLNSSLPLFLQTAGLAASTTSAHSVLVQEDRFATTFASNLGGLAYRTGRARHALVTANRSSFESSRNLLIGAGAGSFALAVALGLLLAASIVRPLRRTRGQLASIAAGDFAQRVDVPNRDEIGALAADVNRMSDELERLYGELEAASRHKSDFLATMSHELRTPLNAIIGFSEVLHEQMFGELNERQLAYVNDVLGAGRHLLSLINDVLDLAKIEAGKMELELSQVALPELLRSAISMHSERASRAGIALGLRTEPAEIVLSADERRVRQIVFNLLSNALKFTPADGRVEVSARLDDGLVEIAVADTGRGIAAEDLEAIFEEFEQSDDGKEAEGTGLGLPVSRKLVELHGGRLWAESEPGRGSTFRFTLPSRREVS
jgi:signal transduction histidine kinase